MTTQHVTFGMVAGDDWELDITVLDDNNNPFDLTTATIMWALLDNHYVRVLDTADVSITKPDPANGKCVVKIPATQSTKLASGFYTDSLRIVIGGLTSTLLFGQINVMADPWAVQVAGARGTVIPFQRSMWIESHPDELGRRPA